MKGAFVGKKEFWCLPGTLHREQYNNIATTDCELVKYRDLQLVKLH